MLEPIEKLRKMDAGNLVAMGDGEYVRDTRHDRIADEIEAEISERYMELPVDADGVPIHVGDELYNGEVIAFGGLAEGGVVFVHRGFVDGNYILEAFASNTTHHAKPRTIEDVLSDFRFRASLIYDDPNIGGEDMADALEELDAKYAAEIRKVVGE